jgi:hypothetical protein
LQFQPGHHHGIWHASDFHAAFGKYDCGYGGQPAKTRAWRVWTGIRWTAFVFAGAA